MEEKSLGSIMKAALIAGVIAGLMVALFHFFVTEPVMDRAIELEEALRQVQETTGETILVDRDAQRVGLFLGFLMYGLTWGLLCSAIYHVVQALLPEARTRGKSWRLIALTGWSVALFPFFKYPANPPGVGDPETVQYRQALYLTFIGLSIASTVVAFALHRYLNRRKPLLGSGLAAWAPALGLYIVGAGVLYLVMPSNPDAVHMPEDLVTTFRVLSLVGLALFWASFAGGFAWLLRAGEMTRTMRRPAAVGLGGN